MRILLVVDLQKAFCKDKAFADKIISLSNKFDKVVATKFVNSDDSLYEKWLNWKCADTELVEGFHPDYVLEKTGYGINFVPLEGKEVYLAGLETDACVLKLALDLWDAGARPIVLTDYVASSTEEYHKAGLFLLEHLIGKENLVSGEPKL